MPYCFPFRNAVEIFFHFRGECDVYDLREVFHKHSVHFHAHFRRLEPAILIFFDVSARLNGADGGSVGRRPADAVLFKRFHERCFRVSRRRLGGVRFRVDRGCVNRIVFRHIGEDGVFEFHRVRFEKAGEFFGDAVCAEHIRSCIGGFCRRDVDSGGVKERLFHLRGNEPPPDEIVELPLHRGKMILHGVGVAFRVGRAYRFVRFLRALRFCFEFSCFCKCKCFAECLRNDISRFRNRVLGTMH